MNINAIVLAAGKGTRMKSKYPKVVHEILKKPMILHVIDNLKKANVSNIVSVVGYQSEIVEDVVKDESKYVYQNEQLGTGHAIMMCEETLSNNDGITIIICGDTPLISSKTIDELIQYHISNQNDATILTGVLDDALAYGRILRENNNVVGIVERKDATIEQLSIKEFNTGTYVFDNKKLFQYINKIDNDNAQQEYYLTDVISLMSDDNLKVDGYVIDDLVETVGINDRSTLAYASKELQKRINNYHMENGVTINDPETTYIGVDVKIGMDSIILPNTMILKDTVIGEDCIIGPNTEIISSTIEDNTTIKFSHISKCIIKNNVQVGPYVRMRENCVIDDNVKIGNFVELKKASMGKGSKSAHLSYLGDATIGEDVNIGCGTITVNYDGSKKHQTIIEDNSFVGCNSNLIAPVTIGKNSFIAAGSTINQDVPEKALGIARARQTNKENYNK